VKTLYQSNQEFYNDIHEETRRVIEGYSRRLQEATPAALEEGAQYLIKEMAFFLASETLLQSNNVTLLYHRRWQVFEQFFSGYYDGITRNIGLLIVTI
jgi:tRNA-dependent cyclodipeptide synthase